MSDDFKIGDKDSLLLLTPEKREKLGFTRLKFDDELKDVFLNHLALLGVYTHAAQAAGITYDTVKKHRRSDPDFNERCKDAKEVYADTLVQEAYRRAVQGWDEPVFGKHDQIGVIHKFSDRLLEIMLKANKPEYRDNKHIKIDSTSRSVALNLNLDNLSVKELEQFNQLMSKVVDDTEEPNAIDVTSNDDPTEH